MDPKIPINEVTESIYFYFYSYNFVKVKQENITSRNAE